MDLVRDKIDGGQCVLGETVPGIVWLSHIGIAVEDHRHTERSVVCLCIIGCCFFGVAGTQA